MKAACVLGSLYPIQPSGRWLATIIITACLMVTPKATFSQISAEVTGRDTIILDNSKGIHHESNLYAKSLLRQAAIYDAIQKGAGIRVTRKVFSSTDDNSELHFEQYVERVLEQYNVTWKLISEDYVALSKKKWVLAVTGTITSEKPEDIDFGTLNDQPGFEEVFVVIAKRFNKVTVNTRYEPGTRLGVYKTIQRKTLAGYSKRIAVKGLLVVGDGNEADDQSSDARIVRGLFRVHQKNEVKPLNFNTNRSGFGYEYSADALPVTTDPSSYGKNFVSHTAFLFLQSYITRFGGFLGYEVIQCYNITPGKIQYINAGYLGLDYNIGIVPGFLYLKPAFNLGLVFDSEVLKDPYWGQPAGVWGTNIILNPRLMAVLRFQKLEFYGGISYKYANDLPALTNSFTTLGLRINLAKY